MASLEKKDPPKSTKAPRITNIAIKKSVGGPGTLGVLEGTVVNDNDCKIDITVFLDNLKKEGDDQPNLVGTDPRPSHNLKEIEAGASKDFSVRFMASDTIKVNEDVVFNLGYGGHYYLPEPEGKTSYGYDLGPFTQPFGPAS